MSSRLEAVRWQFAIDKYIKDHGYYMRTLVAFSGEVKGMYVDKRLDRNPRPRHHDWAHRIEGTVSEELDQLLSLFSCAGELDQELHLPVSPHLRTKFSGLKPLSPDGEAAITGIVSQLCCQ